METVFIIGCVILALLIIIEIFNYRGFVSAANGLNKLAQNMQEAFMGVAKDIILVNNSIEDVDKKLEEIDKVTDDLNSNDALIELYLNLFRDALDIDPDIASRIGKFKHPDTES